MEVILLESIRKLGSVGSVVDVKPGYAAHYLVPNGKAIYASENSKEIYRKKAEAMQEAEAVMIQAAEIVAKSMEEASFSIHVPADRKSGAMYSSLNVADVADVVNKAYPDANVNANSIVMPHIKLIGEYDIVVYLHPKVSVPAKLNIEIQL